MKNSILYLLMFFLMWTLSGCESEPEVENSEVLPVAEWLSGNWDLVSATRNGKETELLTGTYFSFSEDGQMVTNFGIGNGQDRAAFVLEDNKFIRLQDDKKKHFAYEIVLINDTTLVLKTSIRDVTIEMTLKKEIQGQEDTLRHEQQEPSMEME